ncbi:MAG: ankyrin repeat domain-containing protein [Planctomycetota bacterium]|nr:ankyrin repeat domain-containing protein [Planctomycetota bacterium]
MRLDAAVTAIDAQDLGALRALVEADPSLVHERDDEEHALLDRALWALLVGDWSRPPAIAPDAAGVRMAIVRYLLDAGSDVNGRSQQGWTPLHTALYENHVPATELLLERGADPKTEVYGSGGTPLLQALFWGHAEAADALARHDITPRNLRVAAGLGRADLIDEFLEADGTLRPGAGDARGYYRPHDGFPEWSPSDAPQEILDEALCYAARNGRETVLSRLIESGAAVDSDVYGSTPLHWVAGQGRLAIARFLLERGAAVSRPATFGSQHGVTPLHCAAWMDRLEVAQLLLEHGADPTVRDATHDGTPLDWAEYMEAPRVATLLRG